MSANLETLNHHPAHAHGSNLQTDGDSVDFDDTPRPHSRGKKKFSSSSNSSGISVAGISSPTAEHPVDTRGREMLPQARFADPGEVASGILAVRKVRGCLTLRYWNESFYQWGRGRYVAMKQSEVRALVVNYMSPTWSHVKGEHISNVVEHLKAKSILASEIMAPAWIDGGQPDGFAAHECLSTPNLIMHLPSIADRAIHCSVPAFPGLFTFNASECDLDLNAPEPVQWKKFLNDIWGDDRQSIDTLQEFFGYFLTADTRQQKMLILVGPKRGGKGTIARVLRKMIGESNVAGPTLASLATQFGLSGLLDKSVAIVSDARISGRLDSGTVMERLLAISGEDKLTIDRKHLPPVHCQLPTRICILSNELPRLVDASGTIVSRFIMLRTHKSFFGYEDPLLTEKLSSELPGILLWAIEGWKRLQNRGRFVQPESGCEPLETMSDMASPISAFVRDRCILDQRSIVPVDTLYADFNKWSTHQGQKCIPPVQTFGRDLLAAFPGVRGGGQRRIGGKRPRIYEGIRLAG